MVKIKMCLTKRCKHNGTLFLYIAYQRILETRCTPCSACKFVGEVCLTTSDKYILSLVKNKHMARY